MVRLLLLVVSGPEAGPRPVEGLRLAEALALQGMTGGVRVLLQGPAVQALGRQAEAAELRQALEAAVEAGVQVQACTRSLHQYDVLEDAAEWEAVRPVGAPTQVASAAADGWTLLTF